MVSIKWVRSWEWTVPKTRLLNNITFSGPIFSLFFGLGVVGLYVPTPGELHIRGESKAPVETAHLLYVIELN